MGDYKSFLLTMCFPVFGIALVILSLVPINLTSTPGTSPNLLFCYLFVFLFRFPQNAPLISIIIISLFADLLWFRPLGLATLTTFMASEFIRWIIRSREKIGLIEEFVYATLILIITIIIQELVKFFTLIPSSEINQIVQHILFTMFTYLVILFFVKVITRLRRI